MTCELWDREALDAPDAVLASDGKRRLTAPHGTQNERRVQGDRAVKPPSTRLIHSAYHPNGYGTKAMIHARCPADESDGVAAPDRFSYPRILNPETVCRDGSTTTSE